MNERPSEVESIPESLREYIINRLQLELTIPVDRNGTLGPKIFLDEFDKVVEVATLSRKFGSEIAHEADVVESKYNECTRNAMEYRDPLTCIRIRQQYSLYLAETGKHEEALDTVSRLTDGIDIEQYLLPLHIAPNEAAYFVADLQNRMVRYEFDSSKSNTYSKLLKHFAKQGNDEYCNKILPFVDIKNETLGYHLAKVQFLKKQGNIDGIREIQREIQAILLQIDPESRLHGFVRASLEHTFVSISQVFVQQYKDYVAASEVLEGIEFPFTKVREHISLLKDNPEIEQAIKEYLINKILNLIQVNYPLEAHDTDEKQLRNEHLINLLQSLDPHENQEFIDICLYGSQDKQFCGVLEALETAGVSFFDSVKILSFFHRQGDFDNLESWFLKIQELYPDHIQWLRKEYALIIADTSFDLAEKIILENENPEQKCKDFNELHLDTICKKKDLSGWEQLVERCENLERTTFPALYEELSIHQLDPESDPTPPEGNVFTTFGIFAITDKTMSEQNNSTSGIPVLLFEIANEAVKRKDYTVFEEILKDRRLLSTYATLLIKNLIEKPTVAEDWV